MRRWIEYVGSGIGAEECGRVNKFVQLSTHTHANWAQSSEEGIRFEFTSFRIYMNINLNRIAWVQKQDLN